MALSDLLRKATVDDMNKSITINNLSHPNINVYFRQNLDTLKLLYDNNILMDADIDPILERKIINEAKRYVELGVKHNDPTAEGYYVLRTSFLAYALKKGALSNHELKSIDFENETIDSYIKRYHKENLLSNVREDLFNPKPVVIESPPSDIFNYHDMEHPACSCGN